MKMSPREQLLVSGAIALVVLMGVGNFVVAPVVGQLSLLDRKVAQKREELTTFAVLEQRYAALNARATAFEERVTHHAAGFSLFVELEAIAKRVEVREKIGSFKPQEHTAGDYHEQTVEVDLQGLTLEELGRFLGGIETSSEAIYVKRTEIATQVSGGGPTLLRVHLVVGTLVGKAT
ncbi:MAG TPA: hypothetical protein DC005_10560 [Proteobacteria bacterium]|nr:MAG: hypothetical protein CO080_06695 [Nitrospirae bacterium CG_4_9_14_0_8_um_filter_70_14]HBB41829.1 hypothetical protein [Pseudomonadota bacterium]